MCLLGGYILDTFFASLLPLSTAVYGVMLGIKLGAPILKAIDIQLSQILRILWFFRLSHINYLIILRKRYKVYVFICIGIWITLSYIHGILLFCDQGLFKEVPEGSSALLNQNQLYARLRHIAHVVSLGQDIYNTLDKKIIILNCLCCLKYKYTIKFCMEMAFKM